MNLYEIDRKIQDLIDPDTGEVQDIEAFLSLNTDRENLIENIALSIKNLRADMNALEAEERALNSRRQQKGKASQKLESYLSFILGGVKFETPRCVVTFRRSKGVRIDDEEAVIRYLEENGYRQCLNIITNIKKRDLSTLIDGGVNVPGAKIENRINTGVK